jgi:hypothetical protein
MTAWITQPMAEFLHLQVYTLVLAGFSVWALKMTYATALINNDLAADRNLRTGCYMHVQ